MDISDWIARWALFTPDRAAIHFEGRDIAYAALEARVARLAGALRHGLDVKAGDRVAFLAYNSPLMVELVFAAARLGVIVVPLNWRLAAPEHIEILNDAKAAVVIAEPEFHDHLAALGAGLDPAPRLVAADDLDELMKAARPLPPQPGDRLERPVLLCYTSGTTGRAKGAVLTQSALFWNAVNAIHAHDLRHDDHVLTNIPLFHVGGLNIQTLPALHLGARVTIHKRFDPGLTLRDIAKRRPSLALMVPAVMQAVLNDPAWRTTDLASLRGVMAGSSVVPNALIEGFHARGVPVGQIYGATETAPIVTYLRFADAFENVGSCGKPAIHCDVEIVDNQGNPLGPGDRGEIVVRGPNILREYWQNPEATAEAIKDGWFHTGDVAHRDEDGFFIVDDRKKDVVISGGENIYPAQLENVLADCPAIAEAVVVGRPDDRWGEVPVAVVVRKPGARLEAADVLALFQGRLARYKHPHAVIFADGLPRNAMGKILKFKVREMLREIGVSGN